MLPNWLYGKSKSKLASILGGGGGGEPAALTQTTNPNILHNPWFTVNQRGATSVTEADGFIADRWRAWSAATFEATRNSNGYIAVDNISGESQVIIYQKRTSTYLNSLVGKKLTASVMLEDGTIHNGTITYNGAASEIYFDNNAIKLYAPMASTNQILALSVKPGASITIKALKLEVGEISTLHLDPRPEYAIELAKCQRYFIRLESNTNAETMILSYGVVTTNRQIIFALPLPSQMRRQPTIAGSRSIRVEQYGANVSSYTPPTLTIDAMAGNIIRLNVSGLSNASTGYVYSFVFKSQSGNPGGYIDLNAEL